MVVDSNYIEPKSNDMHTDHRMREEQDLHCMMCDEVYYRRERVWMTLKDYREHDLGQPTSGVYHKRCLERYINEYASNYPEIDRRRIILRLSEMIIDSN